jgi:hypothetical protein
VHQLKSEWKPALSTPFVKAAASPCAGLPH